MFETMQKIAIAVLVGMAAVGAIQDWSRDVPSVTADYYAQTQTGGEIEETYTAMGEYDVDYAEYPAQDLLIKQYKIWYPSALAGEEGREWPIVVMANGTGVPASRWSGGASAGALDLLAELNEDPSSLFYHKLDLDNVGSAGHSQGAIGAINAVTAQPNGDSYKALYLASTPSSLYASTLEWAYDPALIDVPCFMTAGTGLLDAGEAGSPEVAEEAQEVSISPLWSQEENYGLIPDSVPKLRARRTGADHAEMLPWPDGYMTAWFMYWLQGDEAAGRAFFGPDAEIVHNPLWQDIEKNL